MSEDDIRVTLPDGAVLSMPRGSTPLQVAESVGPGLAKAALVAVADGEVIDLSRPLEDDVRLRLVTEGSDAGLQVLRHSAAHLLATAVREVRPGAGIGFGPPIEDGFYYDFEVDEPFTPEELERIEERMRAVAGRDDAFERRVVTVDEARKLFSDDPLKLERLEEFGEEEVITVYINGPFIDLCRGPHVPDTGRVKHFRLLSTAGAYWRGDENRQMLQRIYGTAWFSEKDLDAHLERLEEAKRRDHRKLGRELGLYSVHEEVGPGLIHWHPKGGLIRHTIEEFLKSTLLDHGYDLVYTPHISSEALFERSGHVPTFEENMFGALEVDERRYRVKPMNCPNHIMIYASERRSYRDLPLRYAELGTCYRYERSGVLHGMMRVRGFTQDDAHIFCTPEQVGAEFHGLLDLVDVVLRTFGYTYRLFLSTRPEKAIGDPDVYDAATERIREVLDERGVEYELDEGGGAFYGPKLDAMLVDALGRGWQGPTLQLDFNLPERFELEYVGHDNSPHRPVMIHRTLLGSMERFVGGLIEHFAGAFPLWLAPEQARVLPITDDLAEHGRSFVDELKRAGIRATLDDRSETLGYRIRDAETQKVPYMAVIGGREAEAGMVAVRARGGGRKQDVMERAAFVASLREEVARKRLPPGFVASAESG
ncbi:MAG TPA: threonine--tRNA ligase [Longimicrobiales bacterium]|nr:threonine--tRNA ligase [Longimicrobiales bacterium]